MGVKRVNRKVLLVLAVALVVLLVGRAQRHEAAAPALPVSAGDWTASQAAGTFTETGSYGGQQLALVFAPGQDVSLNVSGPAGKLPGDDDVPFHATFDDNASFAFDGDGSGGDGTVQAPVNDSQVAGFTRHLGDGGSLVLSFDDQQTAPLVFPLDGAGATFNALAAAMRRAGVAGQWGAGGGPSAADTVAAVFGLGVGWFFTVLAVLYFLPAVIGYTRGSVHAGVILLLNVLVGWTVIGWWVLLVFAMVSPARVRMVAGRGV